MYIKYIGKWSYFFCQRGYRFFLVDDLQTIFLNEKDTLDPYNQIVVVSIPIRIVQLY